MFPVRQDLSQKTSLILLHQSSPKQNTTKIRNVYKPSLPTWESASLCFALGWWERLPATGARRQPSDKQASCWRLIYQCWQLPDYALVLACWGSEAAQAAQPAVRGRVWMLGPGRSPLWLQVASPAVRWPVHCWHAFQVKCCMLLLSHRRP